VRIRQHSQQAHRSRSYDANDLHPPSQAHSTTVMATSDLPTRLSFHPQPPCAPTCRLPRAATHTIAATPVEALQIAHMRSYVLATSELESPRVFDSMLTTTSAELEPVAPASFCNDSTSAQPWAGHLSHGSLHGSRRTQSHTRLRPHRRHTVG
jgi:hypothetical protein